MHKRTTMKALLFITAIIASGFANADEKKYDICFAAGYFSGEDDKFMIGLSTQIMIDTGVFNDNLCSTAYSSAYKIGVKLSTTGKVNAKEAEIASYATKFRTKVNNALIKLIEK